MKPYTTRIDFVTWLRAASVAIGALFMTSCDEFTIVFSQPLEGAVVEQNTTTANWKALDGSGNLVFPDQFTCKLDDQPAAPCEPQQNYGTYSYTLTNLSEGPHTFVVSATLASGRSATNSVSFTVDWIPIYVSVAPKSGTVETSDSVTSSFSSIGGVGEHHYTCRLDTAAEVACTSPYTYSGVSKGLHTLTVTAIDTTEDRASRSEFFAVAPGPAIVRDLAVGGAHTCVLLDGGNVRCWGRSNVGQLGYGNTISIGDDEPVWSVGNVNVGGQVTQLVAGQMHTCALLTTGKVRCWGASDWGMLGYGNTNTIGDDETPASAGDVDVGSSVVKLFAGPWRTCALLPAGKVRCWGMAGEGELGYGGIGHVGDDETPAQVGDLQISEPVADMALGENHTCVLLATGQVRCWGANLFSGQLGYADPSIGQTYTPVGAGDVNVGGNVTELAAGRAHTCALLSSKRVRCWGDGRHGQLGYGNTATIGDNEVPATAGDVDVGGDVAHIAANGDQTCAILSSGAVRCWGASPRGQLGYGNLNPIGDNESPASAGDVSVGDSVLKMAFGTGLSDNSFPVSGHTCALLASHTVRCWGNGERGQLGYGHTDDIGGDDLPSSVPPVPIGILSQ